MEEIYENGQYSKSVVKKHVSVTGKKIFAKIPGKYIENYKNYKFLNYPENFLDDGSGYTSVKIIRDNDSISWKIRWDQIPEDLIIFRGYYENCKKELH